MIVNCYFWGVFFVFSTFKDIKSCNFKCHKFDKQQNIFLALTDFFLPILKKRRCIINNYQSISLCIPFSRCVLQSFWNRTKKVDSTVNATNRRGTGISGRGPSQYRTQNESQSMPILPEETTRENTFIEQQNDDQ